MKWFRGKIPVILTPREISSLIAMCHHINMAQPISPKFLKRQANARALKKLVKASNVYFGA